MSQDNSTERTITIKILLFAAARDATDGQSQLMITLPCHTNITSENDDNDGSSATSTTATTTVPANSNCTTTAHTTSDTVRQYLIDLYPKLRPYVQIDSMAITMALNEEYIPHGTNVPVHHNDVIAIIPPISGG
jgi:molybdopterin converting factor small subunit